MAPEPDDLPARAGHATAGSHRADPDTRPGWRFALSPQATVVVSLLLAAGVLVGAWLLVRARPAVLASSLGAAPAAGAGVSAGPTGMAWTTPTPSPAGPLVVHVAGLVNRPGVVTLSPGARVIDAVEGAGGPAPGADLGSVNLARQVTDGEQVRVRATGEPAPEGTAGSSGGPVSLNAASVAELEALPGVGPVLAGRIVDWRAKHGRFSAVEELREVSGIGEKLYAALAPLVRL